MIMLIVPLPPQVTRGSAASGWRRSWSTTKPPGLSEPLPERAQERRMPGPAPRRSWRPVPQAVTRAALPAPREPQAIAGEAPEETRGDPSRLVAWFPTALQRGPRRWTEDGKATWRRTLSRPIRLGAAWNGSRESSASTG